MKMTVRPAQILKKAPVDEKMKGKPVVGITALTEKVAKRTRYTKADVGNVIRAAIETIGAELVKGNPVRLPGLGTLFVLERSERTVQAFGRGPVTVPAKRTVRFKVAKDLKEALNKTR